MSETEQKNLRDLAVKLRVLSPEEKNRYIFYLDDYANNSRAQNLHVRKKSVFLPFRLAFSIYDALEGTPYIQPSFTSEMTSDDIETREKFNALVSGIMTYAKVSDEEKTAFKKSALKGANPISKVLYFMKMHRHGMG